MHLHLHYKQLHICLRTYRNKKSHNKMDVMGVRSLLQVQTPQTLQDLHQAVVHDMTAVLQCEAEGTATACSSNSSSSESNAALVKREFDEGLSPDNESVFYCQSALAHWLPFFVMQDFTFDSSHAVHDLKRTREVWSALS